MPFNIDRSQLGPEHIDKTIDHDSEIEKTKLHMGKLGVFLGNSSHSPNNIAALTIFFAFIVGLIYTWMAIDKTPDKLTFSIKDCWMAIIPVITLALGFIFGVNSNNNEPR